MNYIKTVIVLVLALNRTPIFSQNRKLKKSGDIIPKTYMTY